MLEGRDPEWERRGKEGLEGPHRFWAGVCGGLGGCGDEVPGSGNRCESLPTSALPSPDPRPFPATFEGEFGEGLRLHEAGGWSQVCGSGGVLLGNEYEAQDMAAARCGSSESQRPEPQAWVQTELAMGPWARCFLSEPQFPRPGSYPPAVVRITGEVVWRVGAQG